LIGIHRESLGAADKQKCIDAAKKKYSEM